jgi:hypothetical protein
MAEKAKVREGVKRAAVAFFLAVMAVYGVLIGILAVMGVLLWLGVTPQLALGLAFTGVCWLALWCVARAGG